MGLFKSVSDTIKELVKLHVGDGWSKTHNEDKDTSTSHTIAEVGNSPKVIPEPTESKSNQEPLSDTVPPPPAGIRSFPATCDGESFMLFNFLVYGRKTSDPNELVFSGDVSAGDACISTTKLTNGQAALIQLWVSHTWKPSASPCNIEITHSDGSRLFLYSTVFTKRSRVNAWCDTVTGNAKSLVGEGKPLTLAHLIELLTKEPGNGT